MPHTTTKRLGKMTDSVFAPRPVSVPVDPPADDAGADYIKTTIALTKEQMNWLVRLEADIRAKTGASVRRTAVIRALLAALMASDIGLTASKSEAEVTATVVRAMKAGR